ncbi:hypothetical protein [Frondihabitans australicus]|uniref:LppA-like lipoprotein n=1 Tax=Frondihabitans australicus TaxID=386892 RepID=A0A495IDS0_9MICO|nr:hypothetical protein [Frondihabitans australicus]RKR73471.1 hypothetical protein C8E83_0564 [Frondihabitans australicus]
MRLRTLAISLVLGLATTAGLAGCTNEIPSASVTTNSMTPNESIDAMYELYERTLANAGDARWQPAPVGSNDLDITPQDCKLSDGSTGIRYADVLFGPGITSRQRTAHEVAGLWRALGLHVQSLAPSTPSDPQWRTHGTSDDVDIMFTADPHRSSVSIVMACIPGNADDMIDRIIAHREQKATATPSPAPVGDTAPTP